MLDRRANELRAADGDWHAFREEARRTAFNPEQFSRSERERYDLDDAGVTGRDNPETYRGRDELTGDEGEFTDAPDW